MCKLRKRMNDVFLFNFVFSYKYIASLFLTIWRNIRGTTAQNSEI